MKQEDKELLLRDLCARLPYVTMCATADNDVSLLNIWKIVKADMINEDFFLIHDSHEAYRTVDVKEVKPYLFPLSSMTEEQKKEWRSLMIHDSYGILYPTIKSFDYLYKNHIDIRGLIPMGLAIDCTNLNIY